MEMQDVYAAGAVEGTDEKQLLRLAGALEHSSEHPMARAVAAGAAERLGIAVGRLPTPQGFESVPGLGVRGTVEGHEVLAGRERLLAEAGVTDLDALTPLREKAEAAGCTAVLVAWDASRAACSRSPTP